MKQYESCIQNNNNKPRPDYLLKIILRLWGCYPISHLLSFDLLSLSTIQKDAFHAAMEVLQSGSLNLEDEIFFS